MDCFKVNGRPDLQTKHDALVSAGMDEFKAVRQILADEYKTVHDLVNSERAKHGLSPKEFVPLEEVKIESVPEPVVEQPTVKPAKPKVSADKPKAEPKEESKVTANERITNPYGEKVNHEEIDNMRKLFDMSALQSDKIGVEDIIKEALEKHVTLNPALEGFAFHKEMNIALDAINGLPLDAPMQLALGNVMSKLKGALSRNREAMAEAEAKGLKSEVGGFRAMIDDIYQQLDMYSRAARIAGTTAGRALAIRKEIFEFDRFNEANMQTEFSKSLEEGNAKPTREDQDYISTLSQGIRKDEADLDTLYSAKKDGINKIKDLVARQEFNSLLQRAEKSSKSLKQALSELDKIIHGKNC